MSTASSNDGNVAVTTESQAELVIILSVVFTATSTVVFGLRLFTRCVLLKTAGPDDWTMLVAQILAILVGVATSLEAKNGLGRHIEVLSPENINQVLVWLYVDILAYNIALNIVKISFLLQYRRIFPSPLVRRICKWGLYFVTAWMIVQVTLLAIACTPISILEPRAEAWCLDTLPVWQFTSIMSLLTDVAIFAIPIPCIWELPIPLRQRALLLGIFGLGFGACVISMVRVPTLRAAANPEDPTWDNVSAAMFTVSELNAAILCSSLPVLRPLFFKSIRRINTNYGRHNTGKKTTHSTEHQNQHGHALKEMKTRETVEEVLDSTRPMSLDDSSEDLIGMTTMDNVKRTPGSRYKFPKSRNPPAALNTAPHIPNAGFDFQLSPRESPKAN